MWARVFGEIKMMKHEMVVTTNWEYEHNESHCRVCGYVRTGADVVNHIPIPENCPGEAANAAGATE